MMRSQQFKIGFLGGEFADEMTCRDAGCPAWREGWASILDVSTDAGAAAATWIKQQSGRKFYEWPGSSALEEALRLETQGALTVTPPLRACLEALTASMVVFYFHPGQRCFREHLDREVVFSHQTRGQRRIHANGREFNEDQNETAYRLGVLRQYG